MSTTKSSTASSSTLTEKLEHKSKVDPSFKSKRYRDKLRTEVKALEALLPVDRTALTRKLDSQTVFRLVIALLRTKAYFQAVGQPAETSEIQGLFPHALQLFGIDGQDTSGTDDAAQHLQGLSYLQVLDGFLLVLTADGTILYISDNVLQYLGYNQVDLMQRCLYSVIHQDDMMELKMMLETSLGQFVAHFDLQGVQGVNSHIDECSNGAIDACRPLSFICRMRCFSGSSVGYLKMHCSGKIVHLSGLPKSKRSSNNVVLLFCNPFMLRATECTTDLQKNVFWTKHDLDLNIKELDKKGSETIGYNSEELEKKSFYLLVHPEDLTALSTCHKMLVESGEVQTVYFRLQSKRGDWVWLTSRGKVISKNSKKISIAFSHCPIREEDSTYIQQEAILRQRYAISDLMCLVQMKHVAHHPLRHMTTNEEKPPTPKAKKSDNRYQPYNINGTSKGVGKNEKKDDCLLDASCIMEVACPSSWHSLTDRHSPVLPSNHVAHKISQREKQLQFQEFCRRQQLGCSTSKLQNNWQAGHPPNCITNTSVRQHGSSIQVVSPPALVHPVSLNSGYFYPSEARPIVGPGPGYSFPSIQGPAADSGTYFRHWYHSGFTPCDATNHNPPAACLTPTRSPLLCGGSGGGAESLHPLQGNVPAGQYSSFQPLLLPSLSSACVPGHYVDVSCHAAMPPSPPPSPHSALFFQRVAPPYSHSVSQANDTNQCSVDQHICTPRWYKPSDQTLKTILQPPPYPGSAVRVSASFSATSATSDLEKSMKFFFPVKQEGELFDPKGPGNKGVEVAQQHKEHDMQTQQFTFSRPSKHNTFGCWNGHTVEASKTLESNSHFRPANEYTSVNVLDSGMGTSVPKHPMSSCPPQGYFEAQVINSNSFLAPSSHESFSQYMPYAYPSPHPNVASPSTYQYGVYSQYGYQGGQHPANHFYIQQGGQTKTNADYPRTIVEHPLDLPSIGSFLEYLNEV